jgi:putative acetyltransferase
MNLSTKNIQMEIKMIIIKEENPKDKDKIYEINKSAFGTETEAKIVDALREAGELILSLVVQIDDILIGHIAFGEVKIDSGKQSYRAIRLGPMAVLPEHQRKGYGTKLVEQGSKILSGRGHEIVVVLGHPDYYPKFGFVPSQRYGIQCEYECPPEAFMIKELKQNALKGIQGTVFYSSIFNDA